MTERVPSLFRHPLPCGILLAIGFAPLFFMEGIKSLFGWEMEEPGMFWMMFITLPTLFMGCLALIVGIVTLIVRSLKSKTARL